MFPFIPRAEPPLGKSATHNGSPATIDWLELVKWVLGLRKHFKVLGPSMMPTLKAGQHVLVQTRFRQKPLEAGAIVVIRHPKQKSLKLIKRIQSNIKGESVFVRGDNVSTSTDSRDFGPVPAGLIVGRVTSVME